MPRRIFKILLVSTVSLALLLGALLGAAWHQRETLLKWGANTLLARHQYSVTHLQGLQVNDSTVTIAELELALHALGLQILVSEVELAYTLSGHVSFPQLEVLEIGSARVVRDPDFQEEANASEKAALGMGDILQILRDLPSGSLVINALTLPDQDGSFVVELESSSDEVITRITRDALLLTASYSQTSTQTTAQLQASLETADRTPIEFTLTLEPFESGFHMTANGKLAIPDVQSFINTHWRDELSLPVQALLLDWDMSALIADVLPTGLPLPLTFGINPGSMAVLSSDLRAGLGAIRLESSERAEFTIADLASAAITDGYSITLQDGSHLNATLEQSRIGEYLLSSDFVLEQLQLNAGATLSGALSIETRHLAVQGPQPWLPSFDLAADLVFNPDFLTYSSEILLRDAPTNPGLMSQGRYDLDSGAGQFTFTLPTTLFGGEGSSLAAYLGGWPYTFDVMTGSLAAQLELVWQPAPVTPMPDDTAASAGVLSGTITMELVDAAGYFDEFFFGGVNLPFTAVLDSSAALPLTTPPLRLTSTALDVGLVMENLELDFQIDGNRQQLNIPFIQVTALGGTLHGKSLTYDFSQERNQLTLEFTGLRLENMLALTEYEGVAAVGAVSGELPVTFTDTGIEVDAGILKADHPGGSIKYLDAVTDGGNAGINLVNQALSNYQFESLDSTIDYLPDGELLLSMQLQGHNPNMENGQRINLNLNLSNNIPQLLESLQARRAIEDFLEKQYQK